MGLMDMLYHFKLILYWHPIKILYFSMLYHWSECSHSWWGVGILFISYFFISSLIKVFKCFGVYKRDLAQLNVTFVLILPKHKIMEKMERIWNEEDPNSLVMHTLLLYNLRLCIYLSPMRAIHISRFACGIHN
jgi:hypothetical protein